MLYQLYRATEIEGVLLLVFLLAALDKLFGQRSKRHRAWYLLGAAACYAALYYLTPFIFPAIFHPSTAAAPRHPYWYSFLCTALCALLFARLFLRGSFWAKLSYTLFYLAFVQLFKVVCGVLYSAEDQMPSALYRSLDLGSSLLLYLLLSLFALLCYKNRLPDEKDFFSPRFLLALYLPVALLLYYGVRFSGVKIDQEQGESLLAAIILIGIPLLYYLLASLLRYFSEQHRMDLALSRAKAQEERYRLSAELEERLKMERHELKNRYLYIHTLLSQEKYEQLDAYLEEEIGRSMDSLALIATENPVIDYVLNRKIRQAQEKGIKIYSEILLPPELPVDESAFCTVFLNLINNAIEASEDEETPDIHITLKCVQSYLHGEISNHVRPEKITGNPDLHSTKPDTSRHGLGLRIVRETIRRCDGMLQMGLESGYYKAVFMLPLEEREPEKEIDIKRST